ncbi:hypothetical protein CRE_24382 [Caenorhabditis remanei]|uniref:BRCT domain-containing protein n=1 Tax=Caenorhabditis remanei TaxID=31234 RepID=E3MFP3_CAERE|nr:hypothetical protein CRE_24382 [Caenorhabditis remanei]
MRCHLIIVISLLVNFLAAGNSKSNLEEVYDKLSTITRVTNAIVLQAERVKRSVKARDVVAEILKVNPIDLSPILEFDPDKVIPVMTVLIEKLKKLKKEVTEKDWSDLAGARDWVNGLSDTHKAILNVRVKLDGRLGERKILNYFDFIYDKQKDVEMVKNMTDDVLSNWNTLNQTYVTDPRSAMTVWRAEMHYITSLITKISDLDTPLRSFYSFSSTLPLISQILDGLKWFDSSQKIILDAMQRIFAQTDGIWRDPKDNVEKVGESISHFSYECRSMFKNVNRPQIKWTIGFPDRNDMSKVKEDLDNDWFQLNVANGSGVEQLRKELSGFFEIGELMKAAENSWTEFETEHEKDEWSAGSMGISITDFEDYTGGPNGAAMLSDFQKYFERSQCKADFVNYYKWLPSEDIRERVTALSSNGDELQKILSTILQDELKKTLMEELKMIQDNTTITAAEILDDQKFKALHTTIGDMTQLKDILTAFLASHNLLLDQIRDKKDEVVEKSKKGSAQVLEFANCIHRSMRYDIRLERMTALKEMVEFLKNIESFLRRSKYSLLDELNALNYIQKFAEMRNNVLKMESFFENIKLNRSDNNTSMNLSNPEVTLQNLGKGMYVLCDMKKALALRNTLIASTNFSDDLNSVIEEKVEDWKDRKSKINTLIEELESLDKFSAGIRNERVLTMRKVLFEAANTVHGFPEMYSKIFGGIPWYNEENSSRIVKKLAELDLDFVSHRADLLATSLTIELILEYFDENFKPAEERYLAETKSYYIVPISICVAVFLLILICFAVMFGFTETGRKLLKNWYLSHFAKPEEFEKRWRYSYFLDRRDQKSSLIKAVHSDNIYDGRDAVMDGAYINVYDGEYVGGRRIERSRNSSFSAPSLVEMLIKNGADRTRLNAQNRTPEELIPPKSEDPKGFEMMSKVYKKYRKKKFRPRLPQEFPPVVFHIHIDKSMDYVDSGAVEQFRKRFQPSTTHLVCTTHWIVKTGCDGILEISTIEDVYWTTSGVIIVKHSWLEDCLNNERLLNKDCDYLVEKVKYNDVVYNTVIPWAQAMAKGEMPYLLGVLVCIFIPQHPDLKFILNIIQIHGGMFCMSNDLPEKSFFEAGVHPYLHAHLGPVFILHDGKINVDVYRADPEVYTLFTDVEFAAFVLMRGINVDTRKNPISIVTGIDMIY